MPDIAAIACGPVQGGDYGGMLGPNWLVVSVLALTVSTLALSVVYMVASFLRNPQLLGWTKFELFQVFGTVAIMVFFGSTLAGICAFDMSWLNPTNYTPVGQGQTTNMYKIIDDYFSKLQDVGYLIFGYIMYISKIFAYLSRVTVHSQPLGVGSSENPLESMGQINSLIFIMLSGFITSFLLLQLQMRMLDYMALACIGYLFPFGIFFRCFQPTRSFGGTLLGIAVSFFLFYPILMVFNDFVIFSSLNELQTTQYELLLSKADTMIANEDAITSQNGYAMMTETAKDNPSNWINNLGEKAADGLLLAIKPIMIYMIAAVVLPVINFIVLVEITRGTTAFMGDELDVSNLTRMI